MEPDADISGHILTAKGNDELNRKREISIIKELSLQPQIGLKMFKIRSVDPVV